MIFTDPVAQVIITDPESKQEWKWTTPDYPFLTSVTINYERGPRVTVFTIGFDIPYEYGIGMMQVPSPFKQNNVVKARIGYAGANVWTNWVNGFLKTGGDGLSIDSNGVTGQISVQGVSESGEYPVSPDVLKAAGWDPIKILKGCAEGMGVVPVISNGSSGVLNAYKVIGDRRGKAIRKKTFDFSSSLLCLSYWEIVKKICNEFNLVFWLGPKVGAKDNARNLFVYTAAEASKGTDQDELIRTYMIRGQIDEANDVYPCFAWSPEGVSDTTWLASKPDPAAHGVDMSYTDESTGEIKSIAVSPEDQPVAIKGSITDNAPEDVDVDGIKNNESRPDGSLGSYTSMPVAAGAEDMAKAQVQSRQRQGNAAQNGTITCIGLPDERTGNLCRLKGAGLIYDDVYAIDKLTHSYSAGSWEMSLVARREGSMIKAGEQKETSEGQMPS